MINKYILKLQLEIRILIYVLLAGRSVYPSSNYFVLHTSMVGSLGMVEFSADCAKRRGAEITFEL